MSLAWEDIQVVQTGGEKTPCDCCGKSTTRLDGDLFCNEAWIGFYWVRMTEGHPELYPTFSIATGDWADRANPETRWVVTVEYNKESEGFRAIDPVSKSDHANYLDRNDWIGSDFEHAAFAMIDAIFMKDDRLLELHP